MKSKFEEWLNSSYDAGPQAKEDLENQKDDPNSEEKDNKTAKTSKKKSGTRRTKKRKRKSAGIPRSLPLHTGRAP